MKKIILILCCILCCCACSNGNQAKEEKSSDFKSVAKKEVGNTEIPKGVEIVTDAAKFIAVKEDQEYQEQTDANNHVQEGAVNADIVGDTLYCIHDNRIFVKKQNENTATILCSKPDCLHNEASCTAYIEGAHNAGLDYYDGALYYVDDFDQEDSIELRFMKSSSDGSVRDQVCILGTIMGLDKEHTCGSVSWILHRGYLYYIYELGNGVTEDTYYNNGSNCIWRRSLDDPEEAECIMPLTFGTNKGLVKFVADGSYLYFTQPEVRVQGRESMLYRYNTESDQVEELMNLGMLSDYAIVNHEIYYKTLEEPEKVYRGDGTSKEPEILFSADQSIGILYNDILADEKGIVLTYDIPEESGVRTIRCEYDFSGNKIGEIERPEDMICYGFDDRYFYYDMDPTQKEQLYCVNRP